jgi:hypothetical protein
LDQKQEQTELLDYVAAALDRQGIRYAVTGSHASIAYGENRLTNDIDVVVELTPAQLPLLASEFPPGRFYISDIDARHAAVNGGQFNIFDQDTLQKVDFIAPREPVWPNRFTRRHLLPTDTGRDVWFVSPEDLILKKMDFYRQGNSERHAARHR